MAKGGATRCLYGLNLSRSPCTFSQHLRHLYAHHYVYSGECQTSHGFCKLLNLFHVCAPQHFQVAWAGMCPSQATIFISSR